jgi:hypothetical protein
MKTLMTLVLFTLASNGFASSLITLHGQIERVTAAEFDPFVVGDSCVIEVRTPENKNIALVTDFDQCGEYFDELTEGRELTVVLDKSDQIRKRSVLSIFQMVIEAEKFYQVDFGAIENGLAD